MGNTLSGSGPCREAVVALGSPCEELGRRLDEFGPKLNDNAAREEVRKASNALQTAVERIVSSPQLKLPLSDRALLLAANKGLVQLSSALTTLLCEKRPVPDARAAELRAALAERTLTEAPQIINSALPADATAYLKRAVRYVEQLARLITP